MIDFLIGIAAIIGTCIAYVFSVRVHRKWNVTITAPVIISTVLIICVLLIFRIPYETYMLGGEWINHLLGPAVVALAYPLYNQRNTLKKLLVPLIVGTTMGALVGISSGVLMARWAGFEETIIYALTPKSVTTPVAMAVTETLGGIIPLAAVFVMFAGIGGVMIHNLVFRLFRLDHYLGRGVGMGSASHAIGTATLMEDSQLEGSVSTVAMVMSAVVVSIISPALISLLL
ncbi:LrgB family protein [Oceanobacillus sp. M65]|uniref:LrgB family protein n=1 Tax=Oceanobacillus jordanicus TaxID=2867266 RepID=A0AAW5B3E4_9BACI|nr:LrgB family protein [Oceanobacillus jordanicus]MCG3417767.1 LrgB family protein [Oceanobacillus jordanicus]